MKRTTAFLLLLVTLGLLLASCGGAKKNELVGTWAPRDYDFGEDYVLVFNEDGTGTYFGEDITYEVNGDSLSIWWEGTEPLETKFKVDGDVFSFADSLGETVYFVKQG